MCKHGDTVTLHVPIPAHLSATGKQCWKDKPIDRCISSLVSALNDSWKPELRTASSCCGHGKGPGEILLHDGRRLVIYAADAEPKPQPPRNRKTRQGDQPKEGR